jgi:hypothetical protein
MQSLYNLRIGPYSSRALVLWYDGLSGLPGHLTRPLSALGVYHLLVGPKQPWWHGVVERFLRTCRQEVILPAAEDGAAVPQAVETARHFYSEQRCHSQCQDQPPATVYQPNTRHLLADFDPAQAPFTHEPLCAPDHHGDGDRLVLPSVKPPMAGDAPETSTTKACTLRRNPYQRLWPPIGKFWIVC